MNTTELLQNLLLGGLLGFLGQAIRILAGLKKLAESKKATGNDPFDARRMTVSLLLGFVAGAVGVITLTDGDWKLPNSKETLLTLIGIGYSGVDFLEALLTKYAPKSVTTTSQPAADEDDAVAREPNGLAAERVTTVVQVPQLPYSSK